MKGYTDIELDMNKEELAKQYAYKTVAKKGQYIDCDFDVRKELTAFDGYDIEQAYEDGFNKAIELVCNFIRKNFKNDYKGKGEPIISTYYSFVESIIEDLTKYVEE